MYLKYGVNAPMERVHVIYNNYEGDTKGGANVYHEPGQIIKIILVWIFHPGAKEIYTQLKVWTVLLV